MISLSFGAVVALLSSDVVVAFVLPRPDTTRAAARTMTTTTTLGAEPMATFGRDPTDDWQTERRRRLFNPRHDPEAEFGDETAKQLINKRDPAGPKQMMTYRPEQNMGGAETTSGAQPVARSEAMATFGRESTDDWQTERRRRLFNPRHDPEAEFGDETAKQLINKRDPGPEEHMMSYKPEQNMRAGTTGHPVPRSEAMATFGREPTDDWRTERTRRLFNPRHDPEAEFGDETNKQLINFKRDDSGGPEQMMNYKPEQEEQSPFTRNEPMETFGREEPAADDWLTARNKRLFIPRHDPEEEFGRN